jgi:hypothetical protein
MEVQLPSSLRLPNRFALLGSTLERRRQDMLLHSRKRMVSRSRLTVEISFLLISSYFASEGALEICIKEPGGQDATKTNTVLLLDRNLRFKAFGSKALDAYYEDNAGGADLLFEKFKMGLHQNDSDTVPQATALNGCFFEAFLCWYFRVSYMIDRSEDSITRRHNEVATIYQGRSTT